MIKKGFLILIISILLFSLTGCYDVRGVDELSYVIAVGLDEGDNNKIYLTLQFATPNSSSSGSEGKGSNETSSSITTVECSSIDSGIALINSYISKQINLFHCKVVIISETLASKGISEYVSTLVNNIEIRPDCNIIISKCDAKDFLSSAKPVLESLSARYFETSFKSGEYTGYTSPVILFDFFSSILDTCSEAHAILGGINIAANHRSTPSDNYLQQDSSYTAGEMPINHKSTLETIGLAVFKGDKLVGELNGIETVCHLILTNKLKNCTISIPNPIETNSTIDLYINKKNNTRSKVSLVNNTPYISTSVYLTSFGLSSNIDYTSSENLKLIEQYASDYMEEQITSYLYKTSKSYKSDIVGFGKYAMLNYLTWDDWISSNWLSNYENSFFDVNVNFTITSGHLFNKT